MPSHVLLEEEIQTNLQMRECIMRYIQLCLKTDECKPSDVDMKAHLDL